MATVQLVAYTDGYAESTVAQVAAGSFHTVYPIFDGKPGAVEVWAVMSDDSRYLLKRLSSREPDEWRVRGPVEYVVRVKRAGADVDTGA